MSGKPHSIHVWQPVKARKRQHAHELSERRAKRKRPSVSSSTSSESSDSEYDSDRLSSASDESLSLSAGEDEGGSQAQGRVDFDPKKLRDDPDDIDVPAQVASYIKKHIRTRLDRDSRKAMRRRCPRPTSVLETATPKCDKFIRKPSHRGESKKNDVNQLLYNIQDEVLDVVGPLAALYANAMQVEEEHATLAAAEVISAVQQAVVFLGNASEHISAERRFRLLKQSEPSAVSVLQGPLKVEGDKLFGDAFFFDRMKRQAKEVKAFHNLSSACSRKQKYSHSKPRSENRARSSDSHSYQQGVAAWSDQSYSRQHGQRSLFHQAPDFRHSSAIRGGNRP